MSNHTTHKATDQGRIETLRRRHARLDKYGDDLRRSRRRHATVSK